MPSATAAQARPRFESAYPPMVASECASSGAITPTAIADKDGRCGLRAVSGCGLESVYDQPTHSWHFKSDTGELVGASRLDDVPFSLGGCFDAAYQAGEGAGPCPEATTRDLCVSADEGG